LLVEADQAQDNSLSALGSEGDYVKVTIVHDGKAALEALRAGVFDCMVLDLLLPDIDGVKLLQEVKSQPKWRDLPVIVYTGKELSSAEETRLKRYSSSIILKGQVQSPDRLLAETATFLHRVAERVPARAAQAM